MGFANLRAVASGVIEDDPNFEWDVVFKDRFLDTQMIQTFYLSYLMCVAQQMLQHFFQNVFIKP